MSSPHDPVAAVLLPFAGDYILSYPFRSVNAIIALDLTRAPAAASARAARLPCRRYTTGGFDFTEQRSPTREET
jgi:hypothetical protein